MRQYPHLAEVKNQTTTIQLAGRLETYAGSKIMIFNNQEIAVKGVFYMPLPVPDIMESWSINVYNTVYTGGTTQGFLSNQLLIKPAVQIKTDVTQINGQTVFVSGTSTAIIPNWQGWDIRLTRIGEDILVKNRDYTWDSNSGTLILLNGIQFQPEQWFDVEFPIKLATGIIGNQTVVNASNNFLTGSVVKQFRRDQLDAKIWL